MKNETTNATPLYGYATKSAETVTWLDAKSLLGAKRAAAKREPGGEVRVWRMDASTGRHYVVATRRAGKWHDEIG